VCDAADPSEPALLGRRLLRRCGRAALASSLRGAPYASLVLCAVDLDASPLLLLSDLAQHSRNIAFDPRVSLLLDGAAGSGQPLAGPRLSVLGRAEATADRRLLARFTRRHPESAGYAAFADFRLYRISLERGHLVAGFGRIDWIDGADLLFPADSTALAAAEPEILAWINENRHAALARCAGQPGADCRATGCDPEGLDLVCGETALRREFARPVCAPDEVPEAVDRLARSAAE